MVTSNEDQKVKIEEGGISESSEHLSISENTIEAEVFIRPLETDSEKKMRTRSLRIVYFTLFQQALGLAATMPGEWPFLNKVSHSVVQLLLFYFLLSAARPRRWEVFL